MTGAAATGAKSVSVDGRCRGGHARQRDDGRKRQADDPRDDPSGEPVARSTPRSAKILDHLSIRRTRRWPSCGRTPARPDAATGGVRGRCEQGRVYSAALMAITVDTEPAFISTLAWPDARRCQRRKSTKRGQACAKRGARALPHRGEARFVPKRRAQPLLGRARCRFAILCASRENLHFCGARLVTLDMATVRQDQRFAGTWVLV